MDYYTNYGIEIPPRRTSGQVKCVCPNCKGNRGNPMDKSLSVNLDKGVWHCHHCDWSGGLKDFTHEYVKYQPKRYARPKPKKLDPPKSKITEYFNKRGISATTLEKAKVSEGVEFMPQDGKEMKVIEFNYFLQGDLVNVKYRTGSKHFKMVKDAELIPYNIDSVLDSGEVIITEGEMDCLTFMECGFHHVISVPSGANANLEYLDEFWEGWFADKTTVYVASDSDQKGVELRNALVNRFRPENCKIVTYGDGCKDANELLMAHGKDAVKMCVTSAKDVKIEGVFSLTDYEDALDYIRANGLKQGKTLGFPELDELISFETKRFCVITGEPSSGKSQFLDEIVMRLNLRYGWKAAYFTPESEPMEQHTAIMLEKYCGTKIDRIPQMAYDQAKEHYRKNIFYIHPSEGFYLDSIFTCAEYIVKKAGIKILCIDPYNYIESQMGAKSETLYVSEVLTKIRNLANKLDLLVFLVAHPAKPQITKGGAMPVTLYSISGSANFRNKADFGIVVERDYDRKTTIVKVQKVKFRHLGKNGEATFKFNVNNGRYQPYHDETEIIWQNENFLSEKEKEKQPGQLFGYTPEIDVQQRAYDFLNERGDKCPF